MDATEAVQARERDIKKLSELIQDIRIAMLTTVDDRGMLRSRPMVTQEAPFDGDLWFFTGKDTGKVHEVEHDQDVNVAYSDPDRQQYVSVSGKAYVVSDRQKVDELWHPMLKAWFPEGKDDPDIGLIRVRVEKAEYWDSPSGKVVQLLGFVKALTKGERYEGEGSEHDTLQM